MGFPFTDISLYLTTPHILGTPEYSEQILIEHFVSDLYVQKMNGYKPPKTSRVTIQPGFYKKWKGPNRFGSIVSIAPYFNYDDFRVLDKKGKYRHLLDLIHKVMIDLSEEFNWDKTVFEKAYSEIIRDEFEFSIKYASKMSRDKRKHAKLVIQKTESESSLLVEVKIGTLTITKKLFDKHNDWCYDSVYILAKHNKWFDNDRFGIQLKKVKIEIWYSIEKDEVFLFEDRNRVDQINFKKYFLFG